MRKRGKTGSFFGSSARPSENDEATRTRAIIRRGKCFLTAASPVRDTVHPFTVLPPPARSGKGTRRTAEQVRERNRSRQPGVHSLGTTTAAIVTSAEITNILLRG